ncbi:unnamed protein product [Caenorhabditis bovis]|uniref:Uncharacterized protein n=1 Tax=Caenorhabditis bovis TaxID=2654633 RepID=A0A8S1FCM1_9PELO|nr:unnamed protein product [Caenorhabditis bovis]
MAVPDDPRIQNQNGGFGWASIWIVLSVVKLVVNDIENFISKQYLHNRAILSPFQWHIKIPPPRYPQKKHDNKTLLSTFAVHKFRLYKSASITDFHALLKNHCPPNFASRYKTAASVQQSLDK